MITIRGINGDILTHFDNDVPNGNPYFEPVLADDMESLVSSFSFSVPLELADTEHLVGLNQVLVKDRQGDLRLFVITDVHEVWTTVGGTLQVNCEDISINEMNNIIVNPFNGINFNDTLYKTFNGSGWKLKYGANWEDVDNTTMVLENYDNMRSVIASIVDTYGCQFKFMAQENQFGEITRVAEVYKSRGNDTGKYFYYDRDLLGIERDINHADIKTAIHPYYTGYDGKTYSLKGFAPANPDPDFKKDKASPLIINREASKLFDDGNSYRIMPYKTEVEGNPELVYREAIKELKKYAEPIYTYSVNVLLLQNMIGWEGEGIDLGDTVWMKERVGNRELGLEARVTAYEYHEDDPSKDVVTFSNFKEIDTTDVPELAERIFIAYANSEDGIIDFSITDSVGKAYMGVYTAAVSTQSTDPSTYSWTRIKGEDGVSAPTLNLTSSQQVMKFNSNGTPDGDQTIIFTALKQNSTETVTWEAIPYKGDIAQPTITLGGTGDVRSLTSANWNNEWTRVKVTVSMGSLKDIQTVVMVSDGATGASGKAIVGYVTNESTTFAASSDGTVTDYGNGGGKFVLYEGTNKVTSGVTFARVSQVGINLLINDTTGEYKVSNMTTDMAQASVSATYKGITITKFLSFSKSKQGVKGDKGDTGNDGIAGKDGIGLKSTTVTYAASASGTTAPSTGWQEQVPTVAPNNFLWTRTVWTYTDDTSETGYSVAKMGRDGAKGNDGIAGKDGVGIAKTLIEYAVSASGTTKPTSGWSTSIPTTPQGQYLWTRTTWTYTDETTEQGFTVARMGQDGARGNDGIAGKDGVGLKTTAITYAGSTSGTTPPSEGWQTQVPTVSAGQFLWTKTVWTYTDNSNETGYSVAKMGQDGAKGNDGIAGKDGVGIASTLVEYAVSTSGTTRPSSGWSTTIPNTPQGQYLWTRTTWTYTDDTTEQGYSVARMGQDGARGNDGIAGKDGVGLKSTDITYAGSASGTTPPSTGWQAQVPTVPAGQYLWTKTVWTYTDNSNETGYSVARMGQNGNNGKDGIAGKDGVGIKDTTIEYAVNTSGTTKPTSGWSTSIPTVPQGQYLWTRTTWTYTDNTTEQGFTVARQGEKGDKGDQGIAGPKGADGKTQYTHIAYADNASGGGFSQSPTGKAYIGMYVDFEELDSSDPKKYAWSLIKGADGEQGVAGPKGEDGKTPYFHTAYTNSTDFGAYDYSGRPNLLPKLSYDDISTSWTQEGAAPIPPDKNLVTDNGDSFTVDLSKFAGNFGLYFNNLPRPVAGKNYAWSIELKSEEPLAGNVFFVRPVYTNASGILSAYAKPINTGATTEMTRYSTTYTNITDIISNSKCQSLQIYFPKELPRTKVTIKYNIKVEQVLSVSDVSTPYQPNIKGSPWHFSTVPLGENIANKSVTFPIKSSAYEIYKADMEEEYVVGQTYTATIKATKLASQTFVAYNDGVISFGNLKPVEGLTDVWSLTFTPTKIASNVPKEFRIFQYPQSTAGACQIDWVKIEKGSVPTPNIDSYKYLGNYTDFERADSLNPTKYAWNLIKGETPHFHTAYTDSTDFGSYDYSGRPNLMPNLDFSKLSRTNYTIQTPLPYIKDGGTHFVLDASDASAANTSRNVFIPLLGRLEKGATYMVTIPMMISEDFGTDYGGSPIYPYNVNDGEITTRPWSMVPNAECRGKWQLINNAFTVPSNMPDGKFAPFLQVYQTASQTGKLYIGYDIKIEKVNSTSDTATPYQPNLKDAPWYFSTVPLGENILRSDAGTKLPITTTEYMAGQFSLKEPYVVGQKYTFTMKATKPNSQYFAPHLRGGSLGVGRMVPVAGLTDVWQITFTVTQEHVDNGANSVNIFQMPQSTVGTVSIEWAKLEKGDKSTPNIDSYKYLGNYTDFVPEDSLNPNQYSWSLIKGADGNDGAPAKALTLQADSPVMKFDANDVVVAGQVITFTAIKQNFDSNIAWVATPYKGNTAQPAIALKGTGDVRTLEASMWASGVTTIRVDVSADTFRDSVTITKVKDGAKGDKGSDGVAGKDGVGIRSTAITYAGSVSGTTPPTTGWQTQVPTVPAGQFLWTKTVWTYTDNSTETGYSAAMMGKDGAKGNDGIAGKDGVGIKTTVIEYAVNTSGTVKPTSGWTSAVPNTPQGQYLWTRTTWTYTDNTTEQGFTVARQGSNGQNGTNGTNGIDAYSAILSNEANTFAANPAGAVTDWSTGRGTFMVYKGTTRLTSGVTYAVASSVDASGTINATTGDYTITALAKDNGSITFKATIGSTVLTKTMSLSKARQGAQGVQGTMGIAFYSPTEPTGANVKEGSTWFKTVSTADNTIAGIYTYKGGKWVKTEVASGALSVEKLSALSADLGDVTAGNITGVNITGASFVNPFDFTDFTMNHFKGTTEIADAEIGLEGIVNEGTTGARKFVNSITPAYFQSVHKDASGSILRSVNTSSSGIILNDSNVTTSFDKDGLRVVDMPRNASSWSMSTRIGLTRGSDGSTMEMHADGPVLNNRKNIHVWQGTGTNVKAMSNLGRVTFGTYQSIGWGMINNDIPLRVHNNYTWQAKRKIKLELIAQINVQDASADWVYFTAQSGMTTATDKSPRQTITIGRISATKDSGDNRIPLQNTVLCTGYFELNEGEYLSICGNCRTTANCGNVTGMSIAFREIFST